MMRAPPPCQREIACAERGLYVVKTPLQVVAVVSLLLGVGSNICRADQSADEQAIPKADDAYVEAYNKQDATAIAAMWSPEAVYVDPETGKEALGRQDIEMEFADSLLR
jgi:hypothetical protein